MEWLTLNLPVFYPIFPLVVFIILLFVVRTSLLKASLWTLLTFALMTLLMWRWFPTDFAISENKENLVAQVSSQIGAKTKTGINLYEINDWQPAWVFVDITKMARDWSDCGKWDAKTTVPLDSNGYPTEIPYDGINCVQTIWAHDWSHWPVGDYTFTFEGKGTVQLKGKNYSSTGGKVTFMVNFSSSDNAPTLKITKSDKNNPIKNLHLIMPGYASNYETQIFHPQFLKGLEGINEIRFMNWMEANWEWSETEPVADFFNWTNRTKTSSFTQARKWGVAPEYVAALANRLGADAWVNIPYTASDDYVSNYAKFLNNNLNSGLKAYIEYSNELWNGGTYRHQDYANRKGAALGFESGKAAHFAGRAYHIYRTTQIFKIFQDQFSNDSRLVNVVASQAANSWWGQQLLQYSDSSTYNPQKIKIDALAIAPYFGGSLSPASNATVSDILSQARAAISSNTQAWTKSNMSMIKTYCNSKGQSNKCVRLITYEGGQHLRSSNTTTNDKFVLANRQELMGTLFDEMFKAWETENPGELFTVFVYSSPYNKYGSWGMFEYQDQMNTPKYNAYKRRLSTYSYSCSENWSCSGWSPTTCPASKVQTRTCTDGNSCGTTANKPTGSQSCTYTAPVSISGGGGGGGGSGGGGSPSSGETNSSNDKQISALQEQVLKLQKILAALLAQKSTKSVTDNPVDSYYFTSNLKVGSQGKEVKALQTRLNNLGYIVAYSGFGSPGQESQYFGQATKKALARFQLGTGIISSLNDPAAGIFGPKTRAEMNEE